MMALFDSDENLSQVRYDKSEGSVNGNNWGSKNQNNSNENRQNPHDLAKLARVEGDQIEDNVSDRIKII